MKIIIKEKHKYIEFNAQDALIFENKLNLSEKAYEWIILGDALLYNRNVFVRITQFNFIKKLADENKINYKLFEKNVNFHQN